MSKSYQHDRLAQVSGDDQELLGELLHTVTDGIAFEWTPLWSVHAQDVLLQVAQYTEPADLVQRVGNHPAEIIKL
jgi:hypothetical protein